MILVVSQPVLALDGVVNIKVSVPHPLLKTFKQKTRVVPCERVEYEQLAIQPSRGFTELIIICKALHAVGLEFKLSFESSSGYQRSLLMVKEGKADIAAETAWLDDIDTELLFASEAILQEGENIKGIYTLPDHRLQTVSVDRMTLAKYSAVSRENWKYDWQKLRQIQSPTTNSSSYRAIFRMLKAGRADYTLLAFGPSESMEVSVEGITLNVVKNIRVNIGGSRHFVMSKKSSHTELLMEKLNEGIRILRGRGEIYQSYESTGLFNPQTRYWPTL